jgi:hypothetical protein
MLAQEAPRDGLFHAAFEVDSMVELARLGDALGRQGPAAWLGGRAAMDPEIMLRLTTLIHPGSQLRCSGIMQRIEAKRLRWQHLRLPPAIVSAMRGSSLGTVPSSFRRVASL